MLKNATSWFYVTVISVGKTGFFYNCDSLHARLNGHYEAWSYKKKKHKKITAYRKSV